MAKRTTRSEEEPAHAPDVEDEAIEEPETEEEPSEASDSSPAPGDLSKQLEELEELIRESPLAAVGIAAGAGLVLGLLLGRR